MNTRTSERWKRAGVVGEGGENEESELWKAYLIVNARYAALLKKICRAFGHVVD